MLSIKIEDHFSAAHRIEGHPKCGRLHGHNYVVEAVFAGPITGMGYIADFAELKAILKDITDSVDHVYLISGSNIQAGDPYAEIARDRDEAAEIDVDVSSAEQLAEWFYNMIRRALNIDSDVTIESVKVYETPNTWAEYNARS